MTLAFYKYEGLGNDFVVVDGASAPEITPHLAASICDRHFGVGADGVLVSGLANGRPFMRVVNADGSTPEMCGNGLRCVALFLRDRGFVEESRFVVDTDAGPHRVEVGLRRPDGSHEVTVQMRRASLDAGDVLRAPIHAGGQHVDGTFELDGRTLQLTCVSMGNPHVVLFDAVSHPDEMATLGPRIEKDPRFLAGANVGFARMGGPDALDLTVWERGVGFTLACGTGACAAAVAAVETGRARRGAPIEVRLPGGALSIRVGDRDAPIEMRGPARAVFQGTFPHVVASPVPR